MSPMAISARHIEAALRAVPGALGGQPWTMAELAAGANAAAAEVGINTPEGSASFVANCMVESAWFRRTEEVKATPGTDLWHRQQDYAPYYGRTFVQLTWASNYRLAGRRARAHGHISDAEHFVKNPAELGQYRWSWFGPAAFFEENNLIDLANSGENLRVGMGIHAGDPYADRRGYPWGDWGRQRIQHITEAYHALLSAGVGAPSGATRPSRWEPTGKLSTKEVQAILGVAIDGLYGPSTTAAVKELQEALDLTPDGLWGPSTEEAAMSLQSDINDIKRLVKNMETEIDRVNKNTAQTNRWAKNNETDIDTINRRIREDVQPNMLRLDSRVPLSQFTRDVSGSELDSVSLGGALQYVVAAAFAAAQTEEQVTALRAELAKHAAGDA